MSDAFLTSTAISTQHEDTAPKLRRMLSLEQVLEIIPVSPVSLWRMQRDGRFPRGTFISPNRRIWFEDEVIAWQQAISESDRRDPTRRRGKGRRPRSKSPAPGKREAASATKTATETETA
jgi:prophage regulatory protein